VSSFSSAIRESVASLGWGNGILYTIGRALEQVTRGRCRLFKYYFVAQPVPEQRLTALPKASRTRIYRALPTEDIIKRFPRPPAVIAWRFADGAACFVAERMGELVGFIWIKLERYQEDEVRCDYLLDPAQGLAWDFDAWVAPEFRMTRAFVQLWEAANDYLRQQGCHWSVSRISAFNPVSLASHRRMGAVHLHTGLFAVLGRTQLALFSCRPYIHVGFGVASRPRLSFHPPTQPIANGKI
jgi:hypothetical protein